LDSKSNGLVQRSDIADDLTPRSGRRLVWVASVAEALKHFLEILPEAIRSNLRT
jgi:hypothetical protein